MKVGDGGRGRGMQHVVVFLLFVKSVVLRFELACSFHAYCLID